MKILPQEYLQKDSNPLVLRMANETKLKGGDQCIRDLGMVEGKTISGQQAVGVQCSIHTYEAEIAVQAILSYKWLADQNFMVHPRRHGLYFQDEHLEIFVPVITEEEGRPHAARLDKVVAIMWQSVPLGLTSAVGISPNLHTHYQRKPKEKGE